jgi:ATP-dependent Lon protease
MTTKNKKGKEDDEDKDKDASAASAASAASGETGGSGETGESGGTSSGDIYNGEDDDSDASEDSEEASDGSDEASECCDDIENSDDAPSGGFFNKYDEENNGNGSYRGNSSNGSNGSYRGNSYLRRHRQGNQGNQAKRQKHQDNQPDKRRDKQGVFLILKAIPKCKKVIKKANYNFYKKYSSEEKNYFDSLTNKEKGAVSILEDKMLASKDSIAVPMRFKILDLDINERTKRGIIYKIECLNRMSSTSGEYHKINNWLGVLNDIPFNKYFAIPIKNTDCKEHICQFLSNIRKQMNDRIYGHKEAKEQIVRVLAQLISFPKANGYIIGIQGSPGIGKTKLIKEGICNALNYPSAFISLSGADDSSFLRGHSYTYEGATYGKICESLIKTGIMNPLLLFDELDKVSNTYKGQEIINTLIHITDPVQNDRFTDRYFEEIDLDISRSMIVFTFNDESLINPILKDRMIVINVKGYNNAEKIVLARDYIIPEILHQYNLKKGDIIFEDELLTHIIVNIESEEGVRNLKRAINNIISWINMMRYVSIDDVMITLPYKIESGFYDKYCGISNNGLKRDVLHSLYL